MPWEGSSKMDVEIRNTRAVLYIAGLNQAEVASAVSWMTKLAGGCTVVKGQGYWIDQDTMGPPVTSKDDITLVCGWLDGNHSNEHYIGRLSAYMVGYKERSGEVAVCFEFNNSFYLLSGDQQERTTV